MEELIPSRKNKRKKKKKEKVPLLLLLPISVFKVQTFVGRGSFEENWSIFVDS